MARKEVKIDVSFTGFGSFGGGERYSLRIPKGGLFGGNNEMTGMSAQVLRTVLHACKLGILAAGATPVVDPPELDLDTECFSSVQAYGARDGAIIIMPNAKGGRACE